MKKIIFCTLIIAAAGFTVKKTADKSAATANQVQGCYIFTDSKPVADYNYLGSVKHTGAFSGSGQYQPVRDALIKKVKKEYPAADGIIFHFVNGAADRADAIQFK